MSYGRQEACSDIWTAVVLSRMFEHGVEQFDTVLVWQNNSDRVIPGTSETPAMSSWPG